jgi:hypothetical protein
MEKRARRLFLEFVEASTKEGHRPEFHGMNIPDSRVFGDDTFVGEVLLDEPPTPAAAICAFWGRTKLTIYNHETNGP